MLVVVVVNGRYMFDSIVVLCEVLPTYTDEEGSCGSGQRLFCFLKVSHASFSVLNTAPAIILCSVVAFVGI